MELDSLCEKVVCLECKGNIEQFNEELIICISCNTMTTEDTCKKSWNVIVTALVNESKIVFNIQPTLIAGAFEGTLAKSVLKSRVKILYSVAGNKVITIHRAD